MFIKILTPNRNGKVELTVSDLEALIQEAVDKAIAEDRANRPIQFWYGNGDVNQIDTNPNWDWTKVTCTGDKNVTLLNQRKEDTMTFSNAINDIIGEQMK
jgi:hypothetical protein